MTREDGAAERTNSAVIATGSSVSFHGCNEKTFGIGLTRGASSRGMTITASPLAGRTNIVKRSRGMAL